MPPDCHDEGHDKSVVATTDKAARSLRAGRLIPAVPHFKPWFKNMADFFHRHPLSARRKFYVDHTCTDCDFCCVLAPNNFARDSDTAHSYVANQPKTELELLQMREAVEGCPTESIGDDGDHFSWKKIPTGYSGWWSP